MLLISGSTKTITSNYIKQDGFDFTSGKAKSDEPEATHAGYTNGIFQKKGVKGYQWNLTQQAQSAIPYTIKVPKLLLSCLDVKPVLNAALMHPAKHPRKGMI